MGYIYLQLPQSLKVCFHVCNLRAWMWPQFETEARSAIEQCFVFPLMQFNLQLPEKLYSTLKMLLVMSCNNVSNIL